MSVRTQSAFRCLAACMRVGGARHAPSVQLARPVVRHRLSGAGAIGAAPAAGQSPPQKQPVAEGYGGAVVSDTVPSTQAGIAVLRNGGTAADAAVAVAATLGVTDPYVAGIGGGGYFVYYDAKRHQVFTIDGRETTPVADGQNMFIDPATGQPYSFPTAVTSGLSVGVPGTLATWQTGCWTGGAGSPWRVICNRRSMSPIRASWSIRRSASSRARTSRGSRSSRRRGDLFLSGGALPDVGSVFRNPDLANTYRQIAHDGTGALYGGAIGTDIVDAVHNLPLAPDATLTPIPGPMTLGDLNAYRTIDRDPTHVSYRGLDVYGMPPSSSGGITVGESLNILKQFDLSAMDRVQALHHYLESTRLAFADRNRYIGDPAFVNVPQQTLLSDRFAQQRACLIDPTHALTESGCAR